MPLKKKTLKQVLTILFIVITLSVEAQLNSFPYCKLSDSSEISLLTVAPGKDLYSAFGHSGIRVKDVKNNLDIVYNYGTFDFNQPDFYLNFINGKMLYMLSINRFEDFLRVYNNENRSIKEQELNLAIADKLKIFAFLNNNALPQNRNYLYDFFWDNCATRLRDVFEITLGSRFKVNANDTVFQKNKTLHDMLRLYLDNRPWVNYAFDLILGMPCEVIATPRDQTFLPDYLSKYFDCATLDGKSLVIKKINISDYNIPELKTAFSPLSVNLIVLILAIIIWYIERKRKIHLYVFDFILFFVVGLLGTSFFCLWLFTTHYSVPENLNLIWLVPSHAFVVFFLLKKEKPSWLKYYFSATAVLMLLLILCFNSLPQHFNFAIIPLLLLIAFRSILLSGFLSSKMIKTLE
jgi:hypothetical protein